MARKPPQSIKIAAKQNAADAPPAAPVRVPMQLASPSPSLEKTGFLARSGEILFWVALFLAPILGGVPMGSLAGGDLNLYALRGIVLLAAVLQLLGNPAHREPRTGKWAQIALWTGVGFTILSLILNTRFFTSQVLLFALLPATLDWVCYAAIFTLALHLYNGKERSLYPLLASSAWVAVVGILDYRGELAVGKPEARVAATFFSSNFTAGFFALVLPPLVALYLTVREKYIVLGVGAVAALSVGALAATGSRIGIAAAVVGLIIAFVLALTVQRGRLPWARIGALLAAFAVVGFGFRAPLLSRADTNSKVGGASGSEQSVAFRTYTWRGTWRMAIANPVLGTGAGTFAYRYPPYALVASTQLAHESYLQVAAEQGFPALAAILAALALALGSGLGSLFRRSEQSKRAEDNGDGNMDLPVRRLLLCGLMGGLVAGLIRSLSDSEWSLLGNSFPFWAVAGMVAAGIAEGFAAPLQSHSASGLTFRRIIAVALLLPLVLTLILLSATGTRDTLRDILTRAGSRDSGAAAEPAGTIERAKSLFPPDPDLLSVIGDKEGAARIEPSGKRFYQLARLYSAQANTQQAAVAFGDAVRADPNNLQTWRAVAEFKAETGDKLGAIAAWRELIARHEGLVGKVRAISELPETHPAFAYAALAADARARNDLTVARADYDKAARVVEEYSNTPLAYQEQEVIQAQMLSTPLADRRKKLAALYDAVITQLAELSPPAESPLLRTRAKETRQRLAKLLAPDSAVTGN